MSWIQSESTVEPNLVDLDISKKYAYIRRNVTTEERQIDDYTITMYVYEEATVEKELYNAIIEAMDSTITNVENNTSDIDELGKQVEAVTPYNVTKTAYIDDTEITFDNVPSGNMTIYFNKPYSVEREANRVTIYFDALEEVTPITISII